MKIFVSVLHILEGALIALIVLIGIIILGGLIFQSLYL